MRLDITVRDFDDSNFAAFMDMQLPASGTTQGPCVVLQCRC
jgi:hypothetical protein